MLAAPEKRHSISPGGIQVIAEKNEMYLPSDRKRVATAGIHVGDFGVMGKYHPAPTLGRHGERGLRSEAKPHMRANTVTAVAFQPPRMAASQHPAAAPSFPFDRFGAALVMSYTTAREELIPRTS
jgi:hypothetical protein